jgi:thiamine biosynthesis lipoprotein
MMTTTEPPVAGISLRAMTRVLVCLFGLALTLGGCSRPPKLHEIDNFAQGTTYHITWWADHHVDEMPVRDDIAKVLAQIDLEISNYRPDSDIERFNRSRSTDWQSFPPQVIDLLVIARKVYRDSNGCYDPTVGPLFNLWGFRKGTLHVPTQQEIDGVKKEIGFDHVELDVARHRLRKTIPQLGIDMSSVGEGYSIWRLAQVLERHGIHNYILEFGGDMLVKGHKPGGEKWRIAIARPEPDVLEPQAIAVIENEHGVSMNTSGTYRRYFDKQGKTYSHILDPRTGRPVTHDLASATVFDTDPRVGDAWATAMLCLGKSEGEAVAEKTGMKVFFVRRDGQTLTNSESPALRDTRAVKVE